MSRLPAMMLVVALVWPWRSVAGQPDNHGAKGKIVSVGLLMASQASDGIGAFASLEFASRKILPRTLLGFGGSVGYLRSTYQSYLSPQFNYSAARIPVHVFSRLNVQVDDRARLLAYVGPAAGMWFGRYARGSSAGSGEDNERHASLQMETGARYALTTRTAGWGQVSVGTGGPTLGLGVALCFR